VVEFATDNMRHLSLLTDMITNAVKTVSVGIGYGTTAREARSHAIQGMNRAVKYGGNSSTS
jgi:GTP cyclohydrolase III